MTVTCTRHRSCRLKRQVIDIGDLGFQVADAFRLRSLPDPLDHFRLDVHRDDLARATHPPRQPQRVATVAGTHLEHRHARFDAVADRHLVWRLDPAPQRVVDQVRQELRHGELVKVPDDAHEGVQAQDDEEKSGDEVEQAWRT
jgi:hypothetical protein